MSRDTKENGMICGLTAEEHEILRRELHALPETMPSRAVWQRIREQAEAEGLITQHPMRRPLTRQGGLAIAAAIVLAAVLLPMLWQTPQTEFPTESTGASDTPEVTVNALQALMVESRQLESDLRALPGQPRVMLASTAVTISDIEDRIAAIDYQLNDPGIDMSPEDEEIFWRERVRLMRLLVRLRYAQAQRTAF